MSASGFDVATVLDSLDWVGSGLFGIIGAVTGAWLQRRAQREDAARAAEIRSADLEAAAVQRARDAWKAVTVEDVKKWRWAAAERLRDLADEIRDRVTRDVAYAAADRLETFPAGLPFGVEGSVLHESKRWAMIVLAARLREEELSSDDRATARTFIDEAAALRREYDAQQGE